MECEREIQKLLRCLGVTDEYRGFHYAVYGIELAVQDKERLVHITKDLYPDIARKYRTSWTCIERDIRTVVDVIWKSGNLELLQEISGTRLDEKPHNAKFFEILAMQIKNLNRIDDEIE